MKNKITTILLSGVLFFCSSCNQSEMNNSLESTSSSEQYSESALLNKYLKLMKDIHHFERDFMKNAKPKKYNSSFEFRSAAVGMILKAHNAYKLAEYEEINNQLAVLEDSLSDEEIKIAYEEREKEYFNDCNPN